MSRRLSWLTPLLLCLGLVAAGCQSAPPRATGAGAAAHEPAAPASTSAGDQRGGAGDSSWQALVQASEREGKVSVVGAPGGPWREFLATTFSKAYPNIRIDFTGLGSSEVGARIMAEQQGETYGVDVVVTGVTTTNYTLMPAGALDPLPPHLVLPEVLDTANWWQGRHWYSDEAGQYHLMFAPSVSTPISYNTELVNPEEIQSFKDLLDPRWKGKIASWDPRRPGPSSQALRFLYHHPDLGAQFIRDYYAQTDVVVSADGRQIADWVARGRYPLAVWGSGTEIDTAREQGLPVDNIRRPLREGAWVSTSYGGVALVKHAPHSNAATVYVNWLLSRAAQTAMQDIVQVNSARVDVPKDKLLPEGVVPVAGNNNYVFVDLPQYVLDERAEAEIRRISREILDAR